MLKRISVSMAFLKLRKERSPLEGVCDFNGLSIAPSFALVPEL